jgi:Ca2+-binding RTX toxin-like protein
MLKMAKAHHNENQNQRKHFGITSLKELGDKIGALSASSGFKTGNVIVCADSTTCIGTGGDDVIFGGATEQVFGLGGNDILYGKSDNQIYAGSGNDILTAGTGNNLLDGGSGDDVLLGGPGNDLLVGGSGNDKLFAGSGNAIMFGVSGADHFDCPTSTTGNAKAVVMDYNPAEGDTISGSCKIVNTISSSNPSSNSPHVDTGSTLGNLPSNTVTTPLPAPTPGTAPNPSGK